MKKTWIALLLALCMLTTIGAASACCADACCTGTSGMDETQTMRETCPCMMDGKGVSGCPCVSDMCGEECLCMDGKSCMQDGVRADGCMCEKQCACENECACVEKKLDMLTDEMNDVFEKNWDLWSRFFGMMDKQPDMSMSYADYLTEQMEMSKEKFTEEEHTLLLQDIETIRRLDAEIEKLMTKDAMAAGSDMAVESGMVAADGGVIMGSEGMDMADKNMSMEEDSSEKFPSFEGMDLEGNPVTSELFKENSVTVVNFWFSGCAPCIAELSELNALNEELKLKGGAVIGINADTIGGDKSMILEAGKILEKKGAAYQNIYFSADSEAGELTYSITAFPTTVVVDRNGRMVGEPILGGIDNEAQMKALQDLIDETLARDMMMKSDGN